MGVFVMPSLGADMAAGTLVEWLKAPGDRVEHGDIIAVVETDKGAIEVEVFEDGIIEQLLVGAGQSVPVGTPLARIGGSENIPSAAPAQTQAAPLKPAAQVPLSQPLATKAQPPIEATGLRVSPAARRLAAERGVDLASIAGSGPDGAIQLADVEAASIGPAKTGSGLDLAAMRRAIAAAMARSKREIPHYYLMHRFEMSRALDWLDRYNTDRPPPDRLLLSVIILKAAALALSEFPEFNGFYQSDHFVPSKPVHLGNAIAIRGGGLAAPCIRDAANLPLAELMTRLRDLVARTKRGQFRSSEVADATATVSSLGDRGVESLLPVIYPPQVAIIGFGSVERRPWADEDSLVVRPVMTVTLAGDHRANDGHRGSLLLRRIDQLLMHPEAL